MKKLIYFLALGAALLLGPLVTRNLTMSHSM